MPGVFHIAHVVSRNHFPNLHPMTPAARLSSAPRVVIGARVSARGDATPQPGDLQGFSAPVAPGATGLKVQITEVVAGP